MAAALQVLHITLYAAAHHLHILNYRLIKARRKQLQFQVHLIEYADNCSSYNLDNITLTADKSYYSFSYAGESFYFTLKADKPIPKGYSYSTNGALNGFYYSYACLAEDNTCSGFAQWTGKVGRYECKGESSLSISIYADPFTTKGHTPAKITLYGAGTGRDENYPCAMK